MAKDPKKFPGGPLSEMRHAEFHLRTRAAAEEAPEVDRSIKTRDDSRGRKMYQVAVSSETEIERWFGVEILAHDKDAIDFTRFDRGAAVLVNHGGDQVGVVPPKEYEVGDDKVLRAWTRFSKSTRGQEVEGDVADEIRMSISVGYFILDWEVSQREIGKDEKGRPQYVDVYRITRWQPAEVSLVNIPADVNAGVGRSAEGSPPAAITGQRSAEEEPSMKMKKVRDENGSIIEVPENDPRAAVAEQREAPAISTAVVDAPNRAKECADIARMCALNEVAPDQMASWIEEGRSADAVGRLILDARAKKPNAQPAAETLGNDLTPKERGRYSYARAIRIAAGVVAQERGMGRDDGDLGDFLRGVKFDGLEAEVHRKLEQDRVRFGLPYQGGLLVPMDLRSDEERWREYDRRGLTPDGKRSLDSKTLTKGTETVFERPGEMIELLRNEAVVGRLGARMLAGLSGPVSFVKQTGGLTVYWVGENPAADVTSSDVAFGLVQMVAKTLQATTGYTRQLLVQTSVDVENMIREEFSEAHGLRLDKTAFYGLGSAGEPTGIYLAPDVNVRAVGGVPDLDDAVQTTVLVAEDNALRGSLGWVTTPALAGKMRTTPEHTTAAMGDWLWQGTILDGLLAGYRGISSNQMSKVMTGSAETGGAEQGTVFGNWRDLIIGLFQSMELIVDPYAQKKRGIIEVTSFQMADMVLRHGESFCKWTGATLS